MFFVYTVLEYKQKELKLINSTGILIVNREKFQGDRKDGKCSPALL